MAVVIVEPMRDRPLLLIARILIVFILGNNLRYSLAIERTMEALFFAPTLNASNNVVAGFIM